MYIQTLTYIFKQDWLEFVGCRFKVPEKIEEWTIIIIIIIIHLFNIGQNADALQ